MYSQWNMVLDSTGASGFGWKQSAMISVDKPTQTVTYNPHFYAVKHFSHFVNPGALRLDLVGEGKSGVSFSAFQVSIG
jgi:glucosylceramidase